MKSFPRRIHRWRLWAGWLVACAMAVLPNVAMGRLTPSETEWRSWPEYCRVRFAIAGYGADTQFAARISQAELDQWASRMGKAWRDLHHYCYGLIYVDRASASPDPKWRGVLYDTAISHFNYLYHTH